MRILVAGGAGYIGSNMTLMLKRAGHEPVLYDNLSKGHRAAARDAEFIEGDLSDYQLLCKTLKDERIEAVMHFAAFTEVDESVREPLQYYTNNFCNTSLLLRAMEHTGIEKLVFSSSAAVYGMPETVPIVEDLPKMPINPYGHTKWAVERMCHFQSEAGKLRYAALRYFNAAGAGDNGTLGEDHRPESHLVPLTIQAAMGKREDIKIFGTDYPTEDGTCVRDYIHVEDLCKAHILALEKLGDRRQLFYNLGNGTGYSVRQVIETVGKVSGKEIKVTEADRRPGDAAILTADASKAISQLGWKTDYPQLEKIVESAWAWHNAKPNGYGD